MFEGCQSVVGRLGMVWRECETQTLERGVKVDEAGLYKRTVVMMMKR